MRLRMEQHKLLRQRLQSLLTAPRPEFLATADERMTSEQLAALERALATDHSPRADELKQRIRRLQGVLTFTLRTEYHDRLAAFDRHLTDLGRSIDMLNARYGEFVRTRQAAVHSFEGYDTPITRLRGRVADALGRVNQLMARQGHVLELVAIEELGARRERLAQYQDQARFALADSYDRATKARSEAQSVALGTAGAANR
jgi:chromosome segregation ATPase